MNSSVPWDTQQVGSLSEISILLTKVTKSTGEFILIFREYKQVRENEGIPAAGKRKDSI